MLKQNQIDWAISFWVGIALMSLINIWKIVTDQHAVSYDWIMFGFSVIFLLICAVLKRRGVKQNEQRNV